MLIRPKSASRTRTRHASSETAMITPTFPESNTNKDMKDVVLSQISETTLKESLTPSILSPSSKETPKDKKSSNELFIDTDKKIRKRSISSQDHIKHLKSQQSNNCSNGEVLDANISADSSRRCESEQSYVFKSQYSRARNKPYILNIKRAKEKDIPENVIVMSETNQFPTSPFCDFHDSSESQNPRTQSNLTYSVDTINNQGVQDLFSDILLETSSGVSMCDSNSGETESHTTEDMLDTVKLNEDVISSDEVALEALQMDTVEWNPGELIAGVNKVSQENENDSYNPATSEVVFRDDSFELEARKLDSEEEIARHFELIRRRQSQYTPVQSPTRTRSPPGVSLNPKEKRPLFCTSLEDGVEIFAKKERNAFQKLIQRVTRVNVCNKAKFSNGESIEEQKLGMRHFAVGGYPDLQKASGIRVLRHTVERQRSIESTEADILRQFQQNRELFSTEVASKSFNESDCQQANDNLSDTSQYRKKPPARLKPLINQSRQGSVIRVIDNSEEEIPSIIMNGASLLQNVAFSAECEANEDKSM